MMRMGQNWIAHKFLVGLENGQVNLGNYLAVSPKIKIHLPYDPAITILDIYPRTMKTMWTQKLYANIHSSFSQTLETSHVSFNSKLNQLLQPCHAMQFCSAVKMHSQCTPLGWASTTLCWVK